MPQLIKQNAVSGDSWQTLILNEGESARRDCAAAAAGGSPPAPPGVPAAINDISMSRSDDEMSWSGVPGCAPIQGMMGFKG